MADYSNPPASPYHPPHHQQRYYDQQQQQHYHHQASSAAVPTTSNERHNHAGGEASGAAGGLQRNNDPSPYTNVYGDDAGNGTTALDSTSQSQSTSGARYFEVELRTPALARDSTGSSTTTTGGPATSASSSSSYASAAATPTQQYAQPQQAYDTQHYPHQDGHQEQQQQQLVKLELTPSFNDPQSEQQPPYGMAQPNTSSALGHQRHQNPQYLLPPPLSAFRQPTLPPIPAPPDGTIPLYTFGASPLNESDHAAPKVGQTRCCESRHSLLHLLFQNILFASVL